MSDRWLVMGLGNPGPRYERTRHNVGQMIVDEVAARRGESWRQHKAGARVVEAWLRPGGPKLVLAKSNGFMNTSGGTAAALARFFSVAPDRVIVIHDELDIPFDNVKLKSGGGHGGHNGIRDIAQAFGTPDFPRVRVGIGRPPGRQDPADWVLSPFSATERERLPILLADAADAAELIVSDGLLHAQQTVHAPRA